MIKTVNYGIGNTTEHSVLAAAENYSFSAVIDMGASNLELEAITIRGYDLLSLVSLSSVRFAISPFSNFSTDVVPPTSYTEASDLEFEVGTDGRNDQFCRLEVDSDVPAIGRFVKVDVIMANHASFPAGEEFRSKISEIEVAYKQNMATKVHNYVHTYKSDMFGNHYFLLKPELNQGIQAKKEEYGTVFVRTIGDKIKPIYEILDVSFFSESRLLASVQKKVKEIEVFYDAVLLHTDRYIIIIKCEFDYETGTLSPVKNKSFVIDTRNIETAVGTLAWKVLINNPDVTWIRVKITKNGGKMLAVGGGGKMLVYDFIEEKTLFEVDKITNFSDISEDGSIVVSASYGQSYIEVLDTATGDWTSYDIHAPAWYFSNLVVSGDGKRVMFSSDSNTGYIGFLEIPSGAGRWYSGFSGRVNAIGLSYDGTKLFAGTVNGSQSLYTCDWPLETLAPAFSAWVKYENPDAHKPWDSLDTTQNGKKVVAITDDGEVFTYDSESNEFAAVGVGAFYYASITNNGTQMSYLLSSGYVNTYFEPTKSITTQMPTDIISVDMDGFASRFVFAKDHRIFEGLNQYSFFGLWLSESKKVVDIALYRISDSVIDIVFYELSLDGRLKMLEISEIVPLADAFSDPLDQYAIIERPVLTKNPDTDQYYITFIGHRLESSPMSINRLIFSKKDAKMVLDKVEIVRPVE